MDKGEEFWSGSFSTSYSNYDPQYANSTPQNKQQEELLETLMKLPTIGLKLEISPSLVKEMQGSTQSKRKRIKHYSTQPNDGEKLKPSILGALMLQIGSFQVVARNEGELVGKFYFAKRQLVWEILRNGLKEKIEIEWSNIIGIQALMEHNKPGILEVELHHPPKFYKEIEPEPRKHTQWTDGSDFTGGQASINRRHCIVFAPRVLEKHYKKLLDKDKHLFEVSQRPFPTLNNFQYYFPSTSTLNLDQICTHNIQFEDHKDIKFRYETDQLAAEASCAPNNLYNNNDFYTTNPITLPSNMVWLPSTNCERAESHTLVSLFGDNLIHNHGYGFDPENWY